MFAAAAGLRKETNIAFVTARRLLENIPPHVRRRQRALIFLALSLLLRGKRSAAKNVLNHVRDTAQMGPRINVLHQAAVTLWHYFAGEENQDDLFAALDQLRKVKLGGLALVFEAFPHPKAFNLEAS